MRPRHVRITMRRRLPRLTVLVVMMATLAFAGCFLDAIFATTRQLTVHNRTTEPAAVVVNVTNPAGQAVFSYHVMLAANGTAGPVRVEDSYGHRLVEIHVGNLTLVDVFDLAGGTPMTVTIHATEICLEIAYDDYQRSTCRSG